MSQPCWTVRSVTPHPDHTLQVTFADGTAGHVDLHPYLSRAPYAPLADVDLFMRARVSCGTVVWGDAVDIAPELLYELCQSEAL